MPNHVTYLLGAGASYNSMPVVAELTEEMIGLAERCARTTDFKLTGLAEGSAPHWAAPKSAGVLQHDAVMTDFERVGEVARKASRFYSIDTYARYLYLRRKLFEVDELKRAIDVYFTFKQFAPDGAITSLERGGVALAPMAWDYRYDLFVATLLDPTDKPPSLPGNFSALTWNYDLELERALGKFRSDIDDRAEPFTYVRPHPQVIHLNGHSTFPDADPEHADYPYESLLAALERKHRYPINYAWDVPVADREDVSEVIKRTGTLVVIGYSFPDFNRDVDRAILNGHRLTKIYLQNTAEAMPGVVGRVRALMRRDNHVDPDNDIANGHRASIKIVPYEAVDQFYLPRELFEES